MLLPEDEDRRFTEYHLQHREFARERSGLPFHMSEVGARYPRSSLPPLEAAYWVGERYPDRLEAFDLRVYEAFFAETRDISDEEVLVRVASEAGLPGEEIREPLRTRRYRDAVWADHERSERLGVRSIPTVFIGGKAVVGAVPYEAYEQALGEALRHSP